MNGENFVIIGSNGQLGKALQTKYPNARAVDSNVLDISDIRSVDAFDWTNVTHILTGSILYIFGTGPIKGFALTLLIGIITSLFTSIFITRIFLERSLSN